MTTDGATPRRLHGRRALVTGAAGGIGGAACAELFASGAEVVGADRSAEGFPDGLAATVEADLRDPEAPQRIAARVDEVLGSVDIVVHAAGIGAFGAPIDTADDETWQRVLDVNLLAIPRLTRPLLPMFSPHGGVIVNVSSVHALTTSAGVAPYAASKGAVEALTRSMAIDLAARAIRVVSVLPGAIDTPMLREHASRAGQTLEELGFSWSPTDLGRVCSPQEVASVIAFLVSDEASAITGSSVVVDAGLLASF